MNKLGKYLTIKWGVPYNSAAKLEALANNHWHLVNTKKELRNLVYQCIYVDIPEFKVQDVVDSIMQKPPFNTYGDKRYQLFVKGLVLKDRPAWTNEFLNTDEDNKSYYGYQQLYYNWYNTEEEAREKFQKRLEIFKDEHRNYMYLECWPVHHILIYLVDSETGKILEKSMINVGGFDIKKYSPASVIK